MNSGNGMVMVLKQVKQLNNIVAIHLYHDAFGTKMLRNVKGRWRASKKSTKHRGDAPTNLTHALHLTLVGKTSFLYTGSLHRTACTEK